MRPDGPHRAKSAQRSSFDPTFATVDAMLRHYGSDDSKRIALEFKGHVRTYADLVQDMDNAANYLRATGARPGDRLAFIGRNSALYFSLLAGCATAGIIFVPLNWRLAVVEIEEILEDCQPAIAFVDHDFAACVARWQSKGHAVELFRIEAVSGEADISLIPSASIDAAPLQWEPERVLLLLYTSGTTGRAKGVQLTHRALLAPREAERALGEWTHWDSTDKLFAMMPLFHIGCLSSAMMALYQGCSIFIMESADPELLLTAIAEKRLTHGVLVPTLINAMLRSTRLGDVDLTSLKVILYGGSAIAPGTLVDGLARLQCQFAQGYGMTEVAGTCIFLRPEEHDPNNPGHLLSIGRSGPAAMLEVRDSDERTLADYEIGEIWIDSVGLMKGYWNRPEEDRDVLRGHWYRSGDAGYRDADGFFYLTDRYKDMIVSGGENVYPAEVERALSAHPDLLEIAVIGIPNDKWGESVHAIAVIKKNHSCTAESVVAFAKTVLGGFKVPKSVKFIDALPRNAFGKVPKYILREPYWVGRPRRIG